MVHSINVRMFRPPVFVSRQPVMLTGCDPVFVIRTRSCTRLRSLIRTPFPDVVPDCPSGVGDALTSLSAGENGDTEGLGTGNRFLIRQEPAFS